jgi:hypothetical protein
MGLKKPSAEPAKSRITHWADSARNLGVCRLAAAGLERLWPFPAFRLSGFPAFRLSGSQDWTWSQG